METKLELNLHVQDPELKLFELFTTYAESRIFGPQGCEGGAYQRMKERMPNFVYSGSGRTNTLAVKDADVKLEWSHWLYIANEQTRAYSLQGNVLLITPTIHGRYEYTITERREVDFQIREVGRDRRYKTFSRELRQRLPMGYRTKMRNGESDKISTTYSAFLLEWMVDQFILEGHVPVL